MSTPLPLAGGGDRTKIRGLAAKEAGGEAVVAGLGGVGSMVLLEEEQ